MPRTILHEIPDPVLAGIVPEIRDTLPVAARPAFPHVGGAQPHMALERSFDPVEGGADNRASAFAPVLSRLHAAAYAEEGQSDHV